MHGTGSTASLSARTAVAAVWVIGAQFIAKTADFLAMLVLARFLSPADFGLVAMAMTAVLVTEAVTELPLTQALVRVERLRRSMFDTAFTLALLRGAVVAIALVSISGSMAAFFDEPRAQLLICVLAIAPAARGLVSPRLAIPMRAMDFRPEFRLMVVARLCTLVLASGVASWTHSYWAIVAATLTTPLVRVGLSYAMYPYRPRLGLSDWSLFSDLVGWNSLAQVFAATNWQLGRLLLGRLADPAALGFYAMANTIVALPQQALLQPLKGPLMAAFSDAHRRDALKPVYLQASRTLFAVGAPALLMLSVLAEPVVRLALGERWVPTAAVVTWEALVVLASIPIATLAPLAMTIDRTRYVTLIYVIQFVLLLPLLLAGIPVLGMLGVAYARLAVMLVLFGTCFWFVKRLLGASVKEQALALSRPAFALLPMLALLLLADGRWLHAEAGFLLGVRTALVAAAAVPTYVVTLMAAWHGAGRPAGQEAKLWSLLVATWRRVSA